MSRLNVLGRIFSGSRIKVYHTSCTRNYSSSSSLPQKWSYTQGPAHLPLRGVTIGNLLQQQTEKTPDREAVVFSSDNVRKTFSQLLEESDRLAAGLSTLGIKKGDRVGIWGPNSIEWILTQYATARMGAILVNINPLYRRSELEFVLKRVQCKAIVSAVQHQDQDYYDIMFQLIPELASQRSEQIHSHLLPDLKYIIMMGDKAHPGTVKFSDVLQAGSEKTRCDLYDLQPRLQFDDPINIQFTSGTTGFPKGATLTHHNILNNSYFTGIRLDYHNRETRICVPVPLYHCFGMVIGSLQIPNHGATCVFPSPGFDARKTLKAVSDERCTSLYGVPTMFIDLLNNPDIETFDLSTLYTGVMAGSPCPVETMRQVLDKMHMSEVTADSNFRCTSLYGVPTMFIDMLNQLQHGQFDLSSLYTGVMGGSPCPIEAMRQVVDKMHMTEVSVCYGTTENSPVTFQSHRDVDIEKRVTTVGQAHDHVEAKIVNEQDEIVPINTLGELWTRGYTTMLGYWDDKQRTREVIRPDRWYKTGDMAIMDEAGFVRISGRIKDMIIRGGENIYPLEIEQVLYAHPKIKEVQVVGVPDARLGEAVCAWIQLKDGCSATEDEIRDFCRDAKTNYRLGEAVCAWIQLKDGCSATEDEIRDFCREMMAKFKVPKYIQFVTEYPLTVTGKVQKYKIREQAIQSLGLSHVT